MASSRKFTSTTTASSDEWHRRMNGVVEWTARRRAMKATTGAETLLRRDRWIVAGGLALVCALSWSYLLGGAGTGMSSVAMTTWQFPPPMHGADQAGSWDWGYWLVMVSMWWIMMRSMTRFAGAGRALHAGDSSISRVSQTNGLPGGGSTYYMADPSEPIKDRVIIFKMSQYTIDKILFH